MNKTETEYIDKYSILMKKYTDIDPDILLNIKYYTYKNIWNFIVIQWNICIDVLVLKKMKFEYTKIDKCLFNNIKYDEFYKLLDKFIENNIMKTKFCLICMNKYLSR
jgi:hypothetical protein